jgi:spore maturation protein CgeB
MHILYIANAPDGSTSRHRLDALLRCGYSVTYNEATHPVRKYVSSKFLSKFHFLTGYKFLTRKISYHLIKYIQSLETKPDLVWINGGEFINRNTLDYIRSIGIRIILYNNDDPTGSRDGNRFQLLKSTIPLYDLCVVCRNINVNEFLSLGAQRVERVYMGYDEVAHMPMEKDEYLSANFKSEVSFIGTWMKYENREILLRKIHDTGIKLKIWGGRWEFCKDRELVRECWQGTSLSGRSYVHAICGAKVCLGLLSKGNRDQHTQRSMEIPFAGGVLCAEYTDEHAFLYKNGVEALLWRDDDECLFQCRQLISLPSLNQNIRLAGMQRVRNLGVGNEQMCRQVIEVMKPFLKHRAS